MLKKLFIGLMSLLVICVNIPTMQAYASSANVIVTQVQAGGLGAASEELVTLFNNSDHDVDISNWCISNKSNVKFACFTPSAANIQLMLPARSAATISSDAFATAVQYEPTVTYHPTNQNSGSITGSSDTISLLDATGAVIDKVSWTTSLTAGDVLMRFATNFDPLTYVDTDANTDFEESEPQFIPDDQVVEVVNIIDVCPNISDTQTEVPVGYGVDGNGNCQQDICPNVDGLQITIPDSDEFDAQNNCVPIDVCQNIAGNQIVVLDNYVVDESGNCTISELPLMITEVLPNASGSDDGHEFIEVYNPNDTAVDLNSYKLRVGTNFDKSYSFPSDTTIASSSYISFDNSVIDYNLLNTSSRVEITSNDGTIINQMPAYQDPDDDMAWALIDGTWQYTNQPTPGAANLASALLLSANNSSDTTDSSLKPCAANQYRSPDTNRCRLITTTASALTPCKDGEYRSEETNRCRSITSDATVYAPCTEGQERNPDTNRCRNVTTTDVPKADYGVLGAQTSSGPNYLLWGVIAVVALGLGYAIWEWRFELAKLFKRCVTFFTVRKK